MLVEHYNVIDLGVASRCPGVVSGIASGRSPGRWRGPGRCPCCCPRFCPWRCHSLLPAISADSACLVSWCHTIGQFCVKSAWTHELRIRLQRSNTISILSSAADPSCFVLRRKTRLSGVFVKTECQFGGITKQKFIIVFMNIHIYLMIYTYIYVYIYT